MYSAASGRRQRVRLSSPAQPGSTGTRGRRSPQARAAPHKRPPYFQGQGKIILGCQWAHLPDSTGTCSFSIGRWGFQNQGARTVRAHWALCSHDKANNNPSTFGAARSTPTSLALVLRVLLRVLLRVVLQVVLPVTLPVTLPVVLPVVRGAAGGAFGLLSAVCALQGTFWMHRGRERKTAKSH